ncbi:hypothetical protein C7N43_34965 [Sphingobacteriales bacterium UPWRP_1]|nr:hypothetical protein BVG80_07560 [Sphingobacteriales bacterium TSM_CSM]PSJ72295.1 hypothetical protein C7N43_34965 [Sphingobacteriales bacterium UPWRP_1]
MGIEKVVFTGALTFINPIFGTNTPVGWLHNYYTSLKLKAMRNETSKTRKEAQNTQSEDMTLSFKERQQLEIEKAQREARWKMQLFSHV